MISVVHIVDENDFDKILMIRAFTDRGDSRTWASHQLIAIRRQLADKGEDLLDIEAVFMDFEDDEIDDPGLVNRSDWRS